MKRALAAIVVLAPAVVFAQGAPPPYYTTLPPSTSDAGHDPGFVTMDRFDASTRFGAELSYLFPDHISGDLTAARADLHGQYVDPRSGLGVYGALPMAYVSASAPGSPSMSYTAIGDLELGGLYLPRMMTPNVALVLRAGIALPTGASGMNEELSNTLGAFTRLDDLYLSIGGGLSGRFSGSLLVRQGQLFARIDGGIDANKSNSNQGNIDAVAHFNAGAGIDVGQLAVMGEFVNLYDVGSTSNASGSSWIDAAALSIRFHSGQLQPYAAFVIPLDDDANALMSYALTVGIEGVH
ncbi:MAG TPA: hypothetical protein VMJ10_20060 [Kofleriaceae bacterium]|nr:hypothetical protein [Kofleriaceae bacterium]